MPDSRDPRGFLPLSNLSFHLLLALGAGESHGYALGKEIEDRSNGRLRPTTGSLYQALKRLADDGLIERAPDVARISTDGRRQYFRLTGLGRAVTAAEAARLHELVRLAAERDLFMLPAGA
ncbi:MAG: PadR family transcriptional regulator [Gemmatimonadota bacterium]|nr:PadR family transcriptional regulator [Gemmatimonadota bacterium]